MFNSKESASIQNVCISRNYFKDFYFFFLLSCSFWRRILGATPQALVLLFRNLVNSVIQEPMLASHTQRMCISPVSYDLTRISYFIATFDKMQVIQKMGSLLKNFFSNPLDKRKLHSLDFIYKINKFYF